MSSATARTTDRCEPSRGARLLIVDDDEVLRTLAARTLGKAGFDVQAVAGGDAALAAVDAAGFDLILLDLMMPGMDGYEVCRRLRAHPRAARVPILMLTGLDDTESIELAYSHGATDFITKPINWTLLSHRVRYALRSAQAAEAITRSQESLARAQRLAGMGNWSIDGGGGFACSGEFRRLLSLGEGPVSNESLLRRVLPEDRPVLEQARERLSLRREGYQLEYRIREDDGSVTTLFEQAAPVVDPGGRDDGFEAITQDITERVRARERIRQLAHDDEVTGLPNRRFFDELATPWLERARRHAGRCVLMHVDVDRFKGVNDAFGRSQGDAVLRIVADRLRQWLRGSDVLGMAGPATERGVVARIGGNAFTMLLPDLPDQAQAGLVAQRLLAAIAQPIEVAGQSLVLTASVGVAFFPDDAADLAGLARCAEQALYAAKLGGRTQHRFFDEAMNARAASRLVLEAQLRRAIVQNELRVHFQPKVDASSGRVVGAEALVRWQHPQRGLVPPGEFIPLAEETGLIQPLTDWVLENTCRTIRGWRDEGLPVVPVSVNLGASSLGDASLIGKLDALMQRHGLSPACLTLEMTETMLMRDIEAGVAMLETLRTRGYGLSLDDFGTGYSSLSYLKRFPMSELKIDRAFITDAARGQRDGALAAAIITLGRELGLTVVAEGVEEREQMAFLLSHGCLVHQGFLFSRAVPPDEFERMLRDRLALPIDPGSGREEGGKPARHLEHRAAVQLAEGPGVQQA